MTQEELDSLMAGDVDIDGTQEFDEPHAQEVPETEEEDADADAENYRVSAENSWPPPPPTEDHKVVSQLDNVTKDSELKASEIFDKLEEMSNSSMSIEGTANKTLKVIDAQIEVMSKLVNSFPKINTFRDSKEQLENVKSSLENIVDDALAINDSSLMAMDIMQYQDIHRQKIERVINVMRALSHYMNSLFEGKIDDSKRVGSAIHIHGDTTTENVVSTDEIEELIAKLGAN